MRRWGRLVVMMVRPPAAVVLVAFAAVGLTAAGHGDDLLLLAGASVAVLAYFVNATSLNDLSDLEVDRVNLRGARGRPLVSGAADRRVLLALAGVAIVVALGVAAALDPRALAVVAGGAVFNVAYSVRPLRLSARGALAPLLLPVGFVAVPYLTALFATGAAATSRDWWLLAALWVGFTGRIVLKDFRDVVGDGLYGKRTFLVRHGAWATCAFSAACWAVSVVGLVCVLGPGASTPCLLLFLGAALRSLWALAHEADFISQPVEIGAVAVAGRGIVAVVLADLALDGTTWGLGARVAVLAAVTVVLAGSYRWTMSRRGTTSVYAPY